MLRNILVEKILCERYQMKTEKDCGCIKLAEENEKSSIIPDFTDLLSWGLQAGLGILAAKQLASDLNKFLNPYNPPESSDRYSPSSNPGVQLIQPDPGLRTPRKAKVKEFGQATGQVISPS
jgi:hypothetical protein